MRRTVFAIVIVVVMLAAGIGEQFYLRDLFGDLETQTERIQSAIAAEDMAEALSLCDDLTDWWEARKHTLEAVVSHNETKDVTLRIAELRGYVAIGDHKSAYATVSILHETAGNLPHLLGFSWDTVC